MTTPLWPGLGGPVIDYITPPPQESYRLRPSKRLVIEGSTGSVGRNALSVLEKAPDKFVVLGLAGGRNVELLASQANRWRPDWLAVQDEALIGPLSELLDYCPEILSGKRGYATLAAMQEADCVLSGQSGESGLAATLAAVLTGKVVALANKESLVLAGSLLRKFARQAHASILPVDSEHYAIFQCLAGRGQGVAELVLTASGGPFFGWQPEQLKKIERDQALAHPNWKMGAKISVDSATLMNKGLEFIEAVHLFGVSPARIRVVVHPQSIIHSLVRFADNSVLGQFAVPDMRLPLAGALNWPFCLADAIAPLDLTACGCLQFFAPDSGTFPALAMCMDALAIPVPGGWETTGLNPLCIVLNAANEEAVRLFLQGRLPFYRIAGVVNAALPISQSVGAPPAITLPTDPVEAALTIVRLVEEPAEKARAMVRQLAQAAALE